MSKPNKKSANYYQEKIIRYHGDIAAREEAEEEIAKALNSALIRLWKRTGRIFHISVSTESYPAFCDPGHGLCMRVHKDRFSRLHPDHGHYCFNVNAGVVQYEPNGRIDERGIGEAQVFDAPAPEFAELSERELSMLGPEEIKALKGEFDDKEKP